jgi:hypothetical protein
MSIVMAAALLYIARIAYQAFERWRWKRAGERTFAIGAGLTCGVKKR